MSDPGDLKAGPSCGWGVAAAGTAAGPSRPRRVAAVQFEPTLFRKAQNTAALLRLAEEAARAGAELIVLPEMATTGYVFRSRGEIAPLVEPVPGPTTRVFGRLARERRTTLVVGLAEADPETGAFYNSAVVIGPDGEPAGVYRKTHSFHVDTHWAAEGDLGLPVFDGPWPGPLGVLICMDAGFFEAARVQALKGARVVAFPTAWLRASPHPEWRARAAENGLHLVAANRWGEERGVGFAGGTSVLGPRGEVLAVRARGDGVVLADIEPGPPPSWPEPLESLRRRPELYHGLVSHPYLWPSRIVYAELGEGRLGLVAWGPGAWGEEPGRLAGALSGLPVGRDGGEGSAAGEPTAVAAVLPPPEPGLGPGPALAFLREVAARSGAWLGAALAPAGPVVLVGPGGPVGCYATPHLEAAPHSAAASAAAVPGAHGDSAGSAFPVFDLPVGRLGLLTATDLLLPEAPRLLTKAGADAVLVSGCWPEALDPVRFLWAERAETNEMWLAVATDRGEGVHGPPRDPAEPVELRAGGTRGVAVVATLASGSTDGRLATPTRRKERLRRLRPELYVPLCAPPATDGTAGGRTVGRTVGRTGGG
ncbi:MAG: nitrilase [Firmicutes bacterium]|nr:nitrilase [Bacillota bacterium]